MTNKDPEEILTLFIWGFPKITGTFFGVPILRIIVFWGLYWGSLILGNYHIPLGCLNVPLFPKLALLWGIEVCESMGAKLGYDPKY